MSDKIYYGNGKQITTKYGPLIKLSFSKADLESMLENINDRGWINLNVNERKSEGKYGETHSITLDNWKPDAKSNTQSGGNKSQTEYITKEEFAGDFDDDLPF